MLTNLAIIKKKNYSIFNGFQILLLSIPPWRRLLFNAVSVLHPRGGKPSIAVTDTCGSMQAIFGYYTIKAIATQSARDAQCSAGGGKAAAF